VAFVTVRNETTGIVVAENCRIAKSLRDRTVGLLGTKGLRPGEGLLIERSPSIHMFFMRYAIDAVFIDDAGVITKVVESLKPWRVVWWARGAQDCIELPTGAVRQSSCRPGHQLSFLALDEPAHGR
jgi:uncharacterized protein